MSCEKSTILWRISFDRAGNVVANGKHPVGRTTKILETGMWFATFMWDGEFYEARAKCKEHLLSELRAAAGLVPKEMPAGVAVN